MGYRVPWLRRTAAAVGTAALVLGGSMPAAFAHDSVIGGSVKDGDQLDEFPKEITLEFSGIPKEDFNTFAVTNADTGEKLFSQEPKLHERDLTIETPADVHPGPGNYQVGFQITSSDGHATRGGVEFSVKGDGSENTEAPESDTAGQEGTEGLSMPLKIILGVGGVLAIAAVVALFFAKSRRIESEGEK